MLSKKEEIHGTTIGLDGNCGKMTEGSDEN